MNEVILWFSLCEAVEQLQAEGRNFEVDSDELIEKWNNEEAQERIKSNKDAEGIVTIEILKEEI